MSDQTAQDVVAAALTSSDLIEVNDLTKRIVSYRVMSTLREARWEVVRLPEPLGRGMWPVVMGGETEVVAVPSGGIDGDPIGLSGIGGLTAAEARDLAAALLAAAALAEEQQ